MTPSLLASVQRRQERRALALLAVGLFAVLVASGYVGAAIGQALDDEPAPVPATTSTTTPPFCDPGSGARVFPGTGIIESHDDCPQPPLEHAPANTGPNTGPRGEPR